eukprot:TRINITY_DN71253_c1_g1_i1.p1 TRINITY_DN71253_c1_g1~~TRINITY_DN71253_c1_g1_i1.p1  ORF type:complete len:264 (-),score=10.47 TRINITY_DN71253_c1_g1_i1:387-1085(-)
MTGSRTAGIVGHVIVHSAVCATIDIRRPLMLREPTFSIACMWIDNFYSFAKKDIDALCMLEAIDTWLREHWHLKLKDDSLMFMDFARRDGRAQHACLTQSHARWTPVAVFPVLGHSLEANGSISNEFRQVRLCMLRAFWANAGSAKARRSSVRSRLKLLARAVGPQFSWKCSRWRFSKNRALQLDRLQRVLVSYLLPLRGDGLRSAGEDFRTFEAGEKPKSCYVVCANWSME